MLKITEGRKENAELPGMQQRRYFKGDLFFKKWFGSNNAEQGYKSPTHAFKACGRRKSEQTPIEKTKQKAVVWGT